MKNSLWILILVGSYVRGFIVINQHFTIFANFEVHHLTAVLLIG